MVLLDCYAMSSADLGCGATSILVAKWRYREALSVLQVSICLRICYAVLGTPHPSAYGYATRCPALTYQATPVLRDVRY
eukprot:1703817-Rhodomonas_salina.4